MVVMGSLFAAQLREIARNSTNELDLKAQKAAHSQSLLFDTKSAGSQDFETIFQICIEGFEELCRLDSRYNVFSRTIFSANSKSQERTQMTAQQNLELDDVIEKFLAEIGSRLSLRPAVKAVEWLVRRFRYVCFFGGSMTDPNTAKTACTNTIHRFCSSRFFHIIQRPFFRICFRSYRSVSRQLSSSYTHTARP